jgi:hypothetical protein
MLGSNHLLQQTKENKTESESKETPRKRIEYKAIKI